MALIVTVLSLVMLGVILVMVSHIVVCNVYDNQELFTISNVYDKQLDAPKTFSVGDVIGQYSLLSHLSLGSSL